MDSLIDNSVNKDSFEMVIQNLQEKLRKASQTKIGGGGLTTMPESIKLPDNDVFLIQAEKNSS